MRALVTGGAGFIGSNLVDALVRRGDEVHVLDNLATGRRGNVHAGAHLHVADITDAKELESTFAAARPEVVFHLAAQVDVRHSVADPADDLRVNGGGTIAVLDAARRHDVRHLVFASTGGAIYGETDELPTPESTDARPLAPYGMSKLAGEGYCRLYAGLYGLGVTALRFANVYGPRQDPLGEGGVIAIYCGKAVDGGAAVIFGDGTQTRDFVYVGDVVDALLAAAAGAPFGPYNVGSGRETSVAELAERLGLEAEHRPERPGEVRRSCLDAGRARDELGWSATTRLEDGLERTLEWARVSGS